VLPAVVCLPDHLSVSLLASPRSGIDGEACNGTTGCLATPARESSAITAIVAFPHQPARRMTQAARFDQLFAAGARALRSGTQQRQAPPVENGPRWGMGVAMRPDQLAAQAIEQVAAARTGGTRRRSSGM
jgi:hypothetical protein